MSLPSPVTSLKRALPDRNRFEDIDQALLAIEHALQTYTDLYDLREMIEFQLKNIRYDLSKIKK